jgi:hypothetical protein
MVEGMNSSLIYSRYCKNFYKCHSVPPPSTTINKGKETPEGKKRTRVMRGNLHFLAQIFNFRTLNIF